MKDEQMKDFIRQKLNIELSSLHTSSFQREQLFLHATGGYKVKKKLTVGLILVIVLILTTLTAMAIELMTGKEVVEQVAVPMAQNNDTAAYTQESYTHEELVQLIRTLNENGITLEEDSTIMMAMKNGHGYWEEEVLMAICREAFGGSFTSWSIEEKYWYENMAIKIGYKEKNPYRIPGEGDMSVPEARAHAASLLQKECSVTLPDESSEKWFIQEWFYASWTDMDGFHPAEWRFEYVNRKTNVQEYNVSFNQEGNLLDIQEAGFHGEMPAFDSFSMADRYFTLKYGSNPLWPLEAWAEFADAIADLEPESANQWCYINAGYRLPPNGAIRPEQAISIAQEHIALQEIARTFIICCTSNDLPIYKVTLSYRFPEIAPHGKYDAVWCLELDCMTGEILDKWEYTYGPDSKPIRMYVPFSVQESAPVFDNPQAQEDPAKIAEKERQARAYDQHSRQYDSTWYFWPLEAQKDALGGFHAVPVQGELTRDEAVEIALNAIGEKYGQEALDHLGDYKVGAIFCRSQEKKGIRATWEIYVTSDPEYLSNGYRVRFDDPNRYQIITEIMVEPANAENG